MTVTSLIAGLGATIERQSITGQAAAAIREAILSGRIPPGTPLREATLASELRVSRNTVREAARILESESLVRHQMNRGVVVTAITAEDVRDIYAARCAAEMAGVDALTASRDSAIYRELVGLVERIEDAFACGDVARVLESDRLFHATLVAAAGSPRLSRFHAQLQQEQRLALALAEHSSRQLGRTADDHRDLLEALRGSPAQARAQLAAHLQTGAVELQRLRDLLARRNGRQLMSSNSAGEGWELIVTPWHLDEHIPGFPLPAGAAELTRLSLPAGPQTGRMIRLYEAVADAVARAARPLLLSGDCTTALGAVAGLQRRHGDAAVVWLDGHGDFNTPATTITGYLGGMPLAMLTGRAPELISDPLGLRPVAEGDVVLVDARDLDPAERDTLAASRIRRAPAEPGEIGTVLAGLGGKPVYLHVDVDIIDSGQLPGLRVPAGLGPSLTKIEDCLAAILTAVNVTAACIACTWLPGHISQQPAHQALTLLGRALGSDLAWRAPHGTDST